MITELDTIAAIATAVSNAGIGIIRISGSDALGILSKVFRPAGKMVDVSSLESHRIYYGNIVDMEDIIDEVIVLYMKGPRSYTREDVVEIDCHGGITVVRRVLELVIKNGARPAEPGEFTKRAFLNGRIDLTQAEAVMELIDSKNELARKNSVSQLKGRLSEKIIDIRKETIYEIAYIESALDDPEHISLDGYPEHLKVLVDKWIEAIKKLLDSYDNGRMISDGIRTAIVGKPNAGKSSFLNAILGEERAIVTEIAGTTRDTLEEDVTIDGITLRIIDTAGIRNTEDVVEKIGVERARKEIAQADLILFIMDTSEDMSEEDQEILELIKNRKSMILLNKSDVESHFSDRDVLRLINEDIPVISISAKYQKGLENFSSELKSMMFHGTIDINDEVYITSARHKHALSESLEGYQCVRRSIEDGMPEDFFTIDLMNAYEQLGIIIGESVEEDLVNEIFSKFCTGK